MQAAAEVFAPLSGKTTGAQRLRRYAAGLSVSEILGERPNMRDPVFAAGVAILASYELGRYHAVKIAQYTGLPRHFCIRVRLNLMHAGLMLRGRVVFCDDERLTDEMINFTFVLNCLVAAGRIRRRHGRYTAYQDGWGSRWLHAV